MSEISDDELRHLLCAAYSKGYDAGGENERSNLHDYVPYVSVCKDNVNKIIIDYRDSGPQVATTTLPDGSITDGG